MAMARKDYEVIAEAISIELHRVTAYEPSHEAWTGILSVAARISTALQHGNKNFDRDRFLLSCGFNMD